MTRQFALPSMLAALLATLVLAQPAGAAITSSTIDSPSDGLHFYAADSSVLAFHVHGTAAGTGSVDIACYQGGGFESVVKSSVPVVSGSFDVDVTGHDAYFNLPAAPCVLRAVPAGDSSSHPPGNASDPYQGPRIAITWGDTQENGGQIWGYEYGNEGFQGDFDLQSAGYRALYSSFLYAPGTLVASEQLFNENGYFNGGDLIKVDGADAYVPASAQPYAGWLPLQVSQTFDPSTGGLTVTSREPLVTCETADMSCSNFVPAGVELDRAWKTSADGRMVSMTDSWRSTDGASHSLDATYVQAFHTSNAHGAFLFPGTSAFLDYAQNDSIALPHGPATVFVKEDQTTPDAGDPTHPQGAVTYASAPDSSAVFAYSDLTSPNYSEWDSHYVRTIPATRTLTLRFAYAQATALSDVQAFAQEQVAAFAPSLAITSPGDGSNSTTPTVTVGGSATDDAGIASLTVNGHAVAVNGDGSWQTPVSLTPGANAITAVATDADGISSHKEITVTYVPPSPATPVAHLSLRAPRATSSGVTFGLSCSAAPCSGTATLTAIELVRKPGGKLVGVAVRKVKKTVTVGHASFSLRAGGVKTVRIKLNATGRKLLKRFKHLPVRLTVKYKSAGKLTKLPVKKVTIKAGRKHRH